MKAITIINKTTIIKLLNYDDKSWNLARVAYGLVKDWPVTWLLQTIKIIKKF